jgi:hypothetical protein
LVHGQVWLFSLQFQRRSTVKSTPFYVLLALAMTASFNLFAQQEPSDIELLRQEIRQMRSDYEARIADLESRLDAAEKAAEAAPQTAGAGTPVASQEEAVAADSYQPDAQPAPYEAEPYNSGGSISLSPDSSFNPSLGVIFQGQAWAFSNDPEEHSIPGFPLGGEAGLPSEGFSLGETEINIAANVDDKFTAKLTLPIAIEDGEVHTELEEAWIETLKMPAGTSLRMGRFFSNIGYLNSVHSHAWDFADQPLAYDAFLGGQYYDDGLQFRWLAPTTLYLQLSGELLRGGSYPAGSDSGAGAYSLAVKTGGDIGFSNSWLAGVSWLSTESDERGSGDEDDPLLFSGDSDLFIADFVWKWAPNGNSRERNFKLQAEYLYRTEEGEYALPGAEFSPWDERQYGWYVQAIYQPFPQWRFGGRVDALSGDTPGDEWVDTPLYLPGSDPMRYSLMADWSNSEFSRLRFQYNRDESGEYDDDQFGLQYIYSIGAHGAHSF